ncbi:hypothetical protein ABIB99_001911 [Bradyrhizobium sp. LA6.1]|uniref:hypothetical protein n=1 Tax=Bradyrhizobium sp. LA6.1 TaxID=3156378 RepID=UPI003391DD9A
MLADSIEWLSKNWNVLSSAPWVFASLAMLSAAITYIVGTWFKNSEIAILERRLTEHEKKIGSSLAEPAPPSIDRKSDGAATPLPKHRADFLRNIQYGWGDAQIPLTLSGSVATTTDRLRVVLDVSSPMLGLGMSFQPAQFVLIKELKDAIVRGGRIEVQLVFRAVNSPNPGFSPAFFWGDPEKNYPVMPMNKVRVRLIGGHGDEQHIYFFALAGLGGQPITVLPESELDWVHQWRAQDM